MGTISTAVVLGTCHMRMFAIESLLPNHLVIEKVHFQELKHRRFKHSNKLIIALFVDNNSLYSEYLNDCICNQHQDNVLIAYTEAAQEVVRKAYEVGFSKFVNLNQQESLISEELKSIFKSSLDTSFFPSDFSNVLSHGSSKKRINLNTKESEVLKLIWDGFSNIEISIQLDVSERTIERYRSKLLKESGAKNLSGMLRTYLQMGIISQ